MYSEFIAVVSESLAVSILKTKSLSLFCIEGNQVVTCPRLWRHHIRNVGNMAYFYPETPCLLNEISSVTRPFIIAFFKKPSKKAVFQHQPATYIVSMKNSSDTIGNRTRDLPACSKVPQTNAPPCAPFPSSGSFYCLHLRICGASTPMHSCNPQ